MSGGLPIRQEKLTRSLIRVPFLHQSTQLYMTALQTYDFLISSIAWYDVLFQINVVSKALQAKDLDIAECVEMLKKYCAFLEDYRKNGFNQSIITAKHLSEELQIEPVFESLKRIRRAKRQLDKITQDEPIVCPKKKLEALVSLKERFEQLNEYS